MQTATLTTDELQQLKDASADAILAVGNGSMLARILKRVMMQASVEILYRSVHARREALK